MKMVVDPGYPHLYIECVTVLFACVFALSFPLTFPFPSAVTQKHFLPV